MSDFRSTPSWRCRDERGADGAVRVSLSGELDLSVAPELAAVLGRAQAESSVVVVDLRELVFMDSSGLHVLLDASTRARQSGHRLTITGPAPSIRRLFELSGVLDTLQIVDAA